jgi:hypothetical protein
VILTTAETPETVGMFNRTLFAQMKQGSYFINIGRGRCLVTDNLVEALRSGHLAGAGLDGRRSGAVAGGPSAVGDAECADHAACCDLRHPLS